MFNLIRTTAATAAFVLFSAISATAATVSLNPSATTVGQGASFTVDAYMDASDIGNIDPNTYIGAIAVGFDSTLVSYDGFAINAPVIQDSIDESDPQSVEVEFSNFTFAGNVGVIGTFSFTAIGPAGSTINMNVEDPAFLTSFFVTFPGVDPFTPTFPVEPVSIQIAAVPVPAAAWLMLSALGVVGLRFRRR